MITKEQANKSCLEYILDSQNECEFYIETCEQLNLCEADYEGNAGICIYAAAMVAYWGENIETVRKRNFDTEYLREHGFLK